MFSFAGLASGGRKYKIEVQIGDFIVIKGQNINCYQLLPKQVNNIPYFFFYCKMHKALNFFAVKIFFKSICSCRL
jgi:hypothetical protein